MLTAAFVISLRANVVGDGCHLLRASVKQIVLSFAFYLEESDSILQVIPGTDGKPEVSTAGLVWVL